MRKIVKKNRKVRKLENAELKQSDAINFENLENRQMMSATVDVSSFVQSPTTAATIRPLLWRR